MAIEIRVPTLGESITEATVGKWFKKAGEPVQADEPLVELETDKVTLEVNAPSAGVLSEIAAETGQTVAIGALLGQLSGGAAAAAPAQAAASSAKAARQSTPAAASAMPAAPTASTAMPPAPAAAKMAAEDKIDLASVAGSGKRGQVLKGDVLAAIAAAQAPAPLQAPAPIPASAPAPVPAARTTTPDDSAREERVRMTKLRQTIARRLKDAQNTAAMLTTFNEVDMSEVMALRARYKDAFEKKHGAKLGFMGFFVKACVQALREMPAVNAEIDGADLVYKNYYHLGIAVGTDKGLIVPVVRDADKLSIADIEKTIAGARQARPRRPAYARGVAGRNVHHHQRRHLWLADVDADSQCAAVGHPGHAQDPGPPGRRRRQGRNPADDVSGVELRPSHRRRPGGSDLPCPRQGGARRPGAARARPLNGEGPAEPAVGEDAMSELTCLELSVALWLVHVLVQATVGNVELPFGYLFTSRDKPAAASGLLFGRATRALANYVENFTPFVAVALALIVTQRTGGSGALGATIWILARIVYIPVYLLGIMYARTAIWAISIVGLVMMLSRLIGW